MDYEYAGQKLSYQAPIIEQLVYLSKLLTDNGILYWLDFGTLLGAVRNGRIIPWDYDIDISIYHDNVPKVEALTAAIEKDGFSFLADRNQQHARIIRFFHAGKFEFHCDIYPWVIDGDSMFVTVLPEYRLPTSCFRDMGEIEFEGAMYPYWIPVEPFLVKAYGEDWRVPKVLSGNTVYAKMYDPDNTDIAAEMAKYKGY